MLFKISCSLVQTRGKPMKDPFFGRIPYNIMLVRMSSLGDILHALPVVRALKNKYPSTRLSWLVDERYASLLDGMDSIDRVVYFKRSEVTRKLSTLQGFWRAVGIIISLIKTIRKINLVAAITFQSTLRSSLFAFFSAARVRIAFNRWAKGSWFCHNHHVSVKKNQHVILQNLSLIKVTGADLTPHRTPLALKKHDREPVEYFLSEKKIDPQRMVVFCPATSRPIKQWRADAWAALGDRLANEQDVIPVIGWGDENEKKMAEEISGRMESKNHLSPNLTLRESAALLEAARYVVAPDTGPLHLAAAMGTPVVGLYGPTDPKTRGPFWEPNRIIQHDPDCDRKCYRKRRKSGASCRCLESLSVEKVFNGCESLNRQIAEKEKSELT